MMLIMNILCAILPIPAALTQRIAVPVSPHLDVELSTAGHFLPGANYLAKNHKNYMQSPAILFLKFEESSNNSILNQDGAFQVQIQQVDERHFGHKVLFELVAVVGGGEGPFSHQWTLHDDQAHIRSASNTPRLVVEMRAGAETQIELRTTDAFGDCVTVILVLTAPESRRPRG